MRVVSLILLLLISNICFSQNVGIGTTSPNASAQLEVSSTSKGFLPPRMSLSQRNAINNPATGLMIFCTDCPLIDKGQSPYTGELQLFDGIQWVGIFSEIRSKTVAIPTITSVSPMTTISGSTKKVYISGTNFFNVYNITFGGSSVYSYNILDSNTISVDLTDCASGDVVVYTNGGTAIKSGFTCISQPPVISSFSPVSASPGNEILISGSNFNNVSEVKFGNVSAKSFNVIDPNTIYAVLGSGASGSVSVKTPSGTATKSGFSLVLSPPPTITSFSPNPAGGGNEVYIDGTNLNGATSVKFGNTSALYFSVIDPNTIIAVVGSGTTGSVSVTTPSGTATKAGFVYAATPTISNFTPASAAPGATVVISGTNFSGVSEVSFGGVPAASFIFVDANTITAVVGTGGTGTVDVTTPGGVASKSGFTYLAPVIPAPAITSFTPTTASSGSIVTITGTNFTGATNVKFGGTAATSFTIVNASTITAVVGSGASGDVSVTTSGGTALKSGFTFSTIGNIVSKVIADVELNQLEGFINKGLLTNKLSEAGPFTLLAPVDAVINSYGFSSSTLDQSTCELVVAYHTLNGRYLSTGIPTIVTPGTNGNYQNENIKYLTIATPNLPQDSVFITKIPSGDIYVNGINIDNTKKDILADNGVIHKLNNTNGFLFPPFKNALDYINTPSTSPAGLDSLAKAIKRAQLALPSFEQILRSSVITIAAPTNKAFQDFFAAQPTIKKIDDFTPSALLSILSDHIIIGRKFIINIAFATSNQGGATGVNTYSNVPLKFNANPFALFLNPSAGANIVVPDNTILNGVVHKIGSILFK